jgi:hypothetical protein
MPLDKDTNRIFENGEAFNSISVAASAKIFEGSLIGATSGGYGRPLQTGDKAMGFAKDNIDNSDGSDGDRKVDIRAKGKVSLFISGLAMANVGAKVYASDDNTFTLTETNNVYVGKVVRFEKSDYGMVAFDFMYQD